MKQVIIVGSGGHGAEIDDYINYNNARGSDKKIEIIGFLDDNPKNYDSYKFSAPLIGGVKGHKPAKDVCYIIGIANLAFRRKFVEQYLVQGAEFMSLVHQSAYISPSCSLGQGVVIGPNANLGPNTVIGDYSMINSRCSIGHDSKLGKYNFISPNTCFSGFTTIGDGNLFGINSATIPNIKVGNNNRIMAGMVLDKNIGDESTVFYRYKERIIAIPKS